MSPSRLGSYIMGWSFLLMAIFSLAWCGQEDIKRPFKQIAETGGTITLLGRTYHLTADQARELARNKVTPLLTLSVLAFLVGLGLKLSEVFYSNREMEVGISTNPMPFTPNVMNAGGDVSMQPDQNEKPFPGAGSVPSTSKTHATVIQNALAELHDLLTNDEYLSIELWYRKNQWTRKYKYTSESLTILLELARQAREFSLTSKQAEFEHHNITAQIEEAKLRTLRAIHAQEQLEKIRNRPPRTAPTPEKRKANIIKRLKLKKEDKELAQSFIADGYDRQDVEEVMEEIEHEEQLQQHEEL